MHMPANFMVCLFSVEKRTVQDRRYGPLTVVPPQALRTTPVGVRNLRVTNTL